MAPSSKMTDKNVGDSPPLNANQDECDWAMCKAEDFVDAVQDEAWALAMKALEDWGDIMGLADFFHLGKPIKPKVANILARILFGDPITKAEALARRAVSKNSKNRGPKKRENAVTSLDGVPPGSPNGPRYHVRVSTVAPNNRPQDPYKWLATYEAALGVMVLIEKGAARDKAIKQISKTTKIRVADIRKSLQILEYLDSPSD